MALSPLELESEVRRWTAEDQDASWTLKDTLLYALAVGARPARELPLVYERYGPRVIPSFATRLAKRHLEEFGTHLMRAGLTTVLYATTVATESQLPPVCADAVTTARVGRLRNAGKHLLVDLDTSTTTRSGPLATVVHTIWIRDGAIAGLATVEPVEASDLSGEVFRFVDQVRDEQYAIWRLQENLTLDPVFPDQLHIDPEYNAEHGLGPPFITGECTLGFACRAILLCLDADASLEHMRARFKAPVLPGDELVTTVAVEGTHRARFEVRNGDGRIVLGDGEIRYAASR